MSKNENPSDQQTVHSSGLMQIRVWNLTPKNKVRTRRILMRGLNDKNPLNYLLQHLISPFWRICQEILPEVFYNLFLAWHKPQESVKSKTSEANSSSCHGPCSHAPHLETFHCSNWNAKAALLWAKMRHKIVTWTSFTDAHTNDIETFVLGIPVVTTSYNFIPAGISNQETYKSSFQNTTNTQLCITTCV